jgi:hypothetical protein
MVGARSGRARIWDVICHPAAAPTARPSRTGGPCSRGAADDPVTAPGSRRYRTERWTNRVRPSHEGFGWEPDLPGLAEREKAPAR